MNEREADTPMSPSGRFRYSAWDGTQTTEIVAADSILAELLDTMLSGSVEQSLDRALHRGLSDEEGDDMPGLDELRDRLRAERRDLERQIAEDETLQSLVEQLRSSGGSQSDLDPESSKLLDALSADPESAARVFGAMDAHSRSLVEAAVNQRMASHGGRLDDGELETTTSFSGAISQTITRLAQLDTLEKQVRRVRGVEDVDEVDPDLIREVLGEQASDAYLRLTLSLQSFAASGYVRGPKGKIELSARAIQHIGEELLTATMSRLAKRQAGDRVTPESGGSHDLAGTTRQYQFGDPLSLDLSQTVMHAVRRGAGVPVKLQAGDFAVHEHEQSSRAITVLAIDLSRSMGERGYILAAKKLALALSSLIRTRYPRDQLLLTGFSESSRTISLTELPAMTWDRFGFGTNLQEALRHARTLLSPHRGLQRNLILLTDGEPTAYRDRAGKVHFYQPPTRETLAETYAEGDRLRKDGIEIITCVLSRQLQVVQFARELCRRTGGDMIITSPDDLEQAIILQYGRTRQS